MEGPQLLAVSGVVAVVFRRMMSDYKVEMINDGMQEFYVQFHGPNDSEFPFLSLSLFFCFGASDEVRCFAFVCLCLLFGGFFIFFMWWR